VPPPGRASLREHGPAGCVQVQPPPAMLAAVKPVGTVTLTDTSTLVALPPEMRARVDGFFRTHQAWLAQILKRGAARGEFALSAPADKLARFIFSALQGALLVKRTTGDATQLRDVITVMKLELTEAS